MKHKKLLQGSNRFGLKQAGQHYTTAPGKSYVVEAEGGELNYDIAYKNPEKFYSQVMSQNLTKHTAKDTRGKTEVSTTIVKRKVGRILMLVLTKFVEAFRGQYTQRDLERAFNDNRVKTIIQKHVTQRNIQLMDKQTGQPVKPKEMSLIDGNRQHANKSSAVVRKPNPSTKDVMEDDDFGMGHASLVSS